MTKLPFLFAATAVLLASCATDSPPLEKSDFPTHPAAGNHHVVVGKFTDTRKLPANYLGIIHGGPSGEHQKLETSKPVTDIVAQRFTASLADSGYGEESAPANWTLTGEVREFSCERYKTSGATVDIVVKLTKTGTDKPSFTKSFIAEKTSADAAKPAEMQALADATLQQVASNVLHDPEFTQVIASE